MLRAHFFPDVIPGYKIFHNHYLIAYIACFTKFTCILCEFEYINIMYNVCIQKIGMIINCIPGIRTGTENFTAIRHDPHPQRICSLVWD